MPKFIAKKLSMFDDAMEDKEHAPQVKVAAEVKNLPASVFGVRPVIALSFMANKLVEFEAVPRRRLASWRTEPA